MKFLSNYVKQIPLYRSLYGSKIDNFNLEQDFDEYPVLEKEYIIKNFPNNWMTPELYEAINNDQVETTTTSGTTGQRIQILRRKGWWQHEYVRTYRYSSHLKSFSVGIARKAILTTAICSNATCYLDFPSYEDRIISNTLYLNLSSDPNSWSKYDILRIMSEFNTFEPEYLDADPIYLALLLKKLIEFNLGSELFLPRVITLSYELVTAYSRRFIQEHLQAPLVNLYGSTEIGYIYIENEGKLSRCSDLSRVELIPFYEKKGLYHLVVSSFKNEFMPFVKFRTGDLIKTNSSATSNMGADNVEIEYICGREKDVVINDKNEPVTTGEIDFSLGKFENNVLIYQLQINRNSITFRYISTDNSELSNEQKEEIAHEIICLLGERYDMKFKLERSIAPDVSGKFSIIKRV